MLSIGEFSKVTGLTVKTLRFYHEEGLLAPSLIDPQSGYRYYEAGQIETARAIAYLRSLELPLAEIGELLRDRGNDERILDTLKRHRSAIEAKVKHLRSIARSLDQFISQEQEASAMSAGNFEVEEKNVGAMLIAGVRQKGKYSDCGQGFAKLGRSLGRYICGKPFLLHYDMEYKEDGADFEACFPIRQGKAVDGISVRELPAARCITLVHKGPWDQLGHSYARIFKHLNERKLMAQSPTREVYIKGPGMIFKGNPKNYLTEIQIPIG